MVLFRRAAFAAFLMFRLAAARCFFVVIFFGELKVYGISTLTIHYGAAVWM